MSGTNPVSIWADSDYAGGATGTGYPLQIDKNFRVAKRITDRFAPRPQSSPDMTVRIDEGYILSGTTLNETAAQNTGAFTAPVSNSRIDWIVGDNTTGAISVVAGVADASPSPPAIPSGKFPIALVTLASTTTAISGNEITDRRAFPGGGSGGGVISSRQSFGVGSGTYTPTAGCVFAKGRLKGGGASGGGAGTGAGDGTNGGDSTINGLTAKGGVAGLKGLGGTSYGTAGVNGSHGAGTALFRAIGADGFNGGDLLNNVGQGGNGGNGGRGGQQQTGSGHGQPGKAPGSGGGGGSGAGGTDYGGGGGAEGEYLEFSITAPSPSGYAYTVGAGGAANTSGTYHSGAGVAGYLDIEEFF